MYILIWVSGLAAGLLLVAAITAIAARAKRFLSRATWPILSALLVLIFFAAPTMLGYVLYFDKFQPRWLFAGAGSLVLAYLIGAVFMLIRGLKGCGTRPRAADWPAKGLVVILLLAVLALSGEIFYMDRRVQSGISTQAAEADRRIQELIPPALPDQENAFPLYRQAVTAIGDVTALPEWFGQAKIDDPLPGPDELGLFIAEKSQVLDLLRVASKRKGFDQNLKTEYLITSPVPQPSDFILIGRFLRLSAKHHILAGEPEKAAEAISILEDIKEKTLATPTLLSLLIAAELQAFTTEVVSFYASRIQDPPAEFATRPVEIVSIKPHVAAAVELEQAAMQQALLQASQSRGLLDLYGGGAWLMAAPAAVFWRVFMIPSDIVSLNARYGQQLEAVSRPFHQGIPALADLEASFENDKGGLITALTLPPLENYFLRAAAFESRVNLTGLARACALYRRDHGDFPNSLSELTPEYVRSVPEDPFDGEPMKMKIVDDGIEIFSVGQAPDAGRPETAGPITIFLGNQGEANP